MGRTAEPRWYRGFAAVFGCAWKSASVPAIPVAGAHPAFPRHGGCPVPNAGRASVDKAGSAFPPRSWRAANDEAGATRPGLSNTVLLSSLALDLCDQRAYLVAEGLVGFHHVGDLVARVHRRRVVLLPEFARDLGQRG